MELHLPLVLATPTLLCLLAALAARIWPHRSVLWPFLLPAAALCALLVRLIELRAELAGPALRWFRIDVPGVLLTAVVLPATALALRRARSDPSVAALRARPWRVALVHAAAAPLGLVPPPALLAILAQLGPWSWRAPAARWWLGFAALAALAAWPVPGLADAVGGATLVACAAALRADVPRQRPWILLAAALAVLAFARAVARL